MSDKTEDAIAQIDQPGRVTWHSSGEDEGPDVGLSFGLGNGSSLYVGEISRAHHAAEAETAGHLGGYTGWWIILHDAEVARVIGKATEPKAGRALIDALTEAFPRRSSVQEAAPATAADGLTETAKRYTDEIDAARAGSDWLEGIRAEHCSSAPSNIETFSLLRNGVDVNGGLSVLWGYAGQMVASYAVVRDDANCSVLVKHLSVARAVAPAGVPEGVWMPDEPSETALKAFWSALGWEKCESAIAEARALYFAARRALLSTAPTAQGQDNGWFTMAGDWRDEMVAIHGPNGLIASGLTTEQANALIEAHGRRPSAPSAGEA